MTKAKYLISLGKLEKHKDLAPFVGTGDNKGVRSDGATDERRIETDGRTRDRATDERTNAARVQTTPMPHGMIVVCTWGAEDR